MKNILFLLLLSVALLLMIPSTVFAGDYTCPDVNKNDSYQRILAINYAAEHVTTHNLVYPYYNNANCTNYVSQCLNSGGMPQINNASYPATRQWYMRRKLPSWNHSNTWTVAHDFRYHWANVNNTGWNRCYQYKIYSSAYNLRTSNTLWNDLYDRCSGGDVIQYVYGPSSAQYGRTYHSQLVHRRSLPNSSKKISMAQNSNDGWRNLRTQSLVSSANDTIICLIRIKAVQRPIDTINP
jgi:hypothetical protein